MNACQPVESREDHVHLPVDIPQKGWDSECEDAVPEPVRCCSKGDGFGTNFAWEYLDDKY